MSESKTTAAGGRAAASGQVGASRVNLAVRDDRVRAVLGSLDLGKDVIFWATVRHDDDGGTRLTINAATGKQDVSTSEKYTVNASVEVDASAALKDALNKAIDTYEDEVLDRLKLAVAQNIVASMTQPAQPNGNGAH